MFETIRTRFGSLAVWLGLIKPEQLDHALSTHNQTCLPLGEHLQDLGHIAPDQAELVLHAQQTARTYTHTVRSGNTASVIVSTYRNNIAILAFEGKFLLQESGWSFFNEIPISGVRIVDLGGVTALNREGAMGLWMLLGGTGIILCNLPNHAKEVLAELGMSDVLPVSTDLAFAKILAKELLEETLELEPYHPLRNAHYKSPIIGVEIYQSLTIHEIHQDGLLILELSGYLTMATSDQVMNVLSDMEESFLVMDLTGIIHCDNDGIGALIQVTDVLPSVLVTHQLAQDRLEELGLSHLIPSASTPEEALSLLGITPSKDE